MFSLSVFFRDRLIARSLFDQEEVRIGRSADNEVHLDNLGISRYHASVAAVEGAFIVKDFGSDNGTFVNGERVVGRRALDDGDRLTLGKFTIVFRCDRPKVEKAPIRDAASFALAGQTIVAQVKAAVPERSCPWSAYVEIDAGPSMPPHVHRVDKDVTIVGSAPGADLLLPAESCPPRAAAIVRGWTRFSLLALGAPVERNSVAVNGRTDLAPGDELSFGKSVCRFVLSEREAAP